jgi:N-formylglutamate amidohydrolase
MAIVQMVLLVALLCFSFDALAQSANAPDKLLTVWAGMLPIILSAPHGGRQPIPDVPARRGVGVAQFAASRDANTDELAQKVAQNLAERFGAKPFLIVALFERKYIDANRPAGAAYESNQASLYYLAYHRAVQEACERVRHEWGRGLLLDIHGQGTQVEMIYRGTNNGKTVVSLIQKFGLAALSGSKSIHGQLEQKRYKIFPPGNTSHNEERTYVGGYIVQTYGSHQGTAIDAIQLEFGANLRQRSVLDRTATDLADAIAVFAREYLPLKKFPAAVETVTQP